MVRSKSRTGHRATSSLRWIMCHMPACQQLPHQDPVNHKDPLKHHAQAVPSGKLATEKLSPPCVRTPALLRIVHQAASAGGSTVSGALRHHWRRFEEVSYLIHSCRGVLRLGMRALVGVHQPAHSAKAYMQTFGSAACNGMHVRPAA